MPRLSSLWVSTALASLPIGAAGSAPFDQIPPGPGHAWHIRADAGLLRDYGYVGDGRSHPLSTVWSFDGVSTRTWSLATWQKVLTAATSLSDEIDWAAAQSYIDNATRPTSLHLPAGTGLFNKALMVCEQSIVIYGEGGINQAGGVGGTTLKFTGGTDGIVHCGKSAAGKSPTSKIELRDLSLLSTTITGSIVGVRDLAANNTDLRNVAISGFNNGVNFSNPRGTHLSNVVLAAGQAAGIAAMGTSTGLYYRGTASFVNHMESVLSQGFELGYAFISQTGAAPLAPGGIEDLQVTNSACGGENRCILIDSENPNYGPFNYSFTNMSVDVVSQFASIPTANDVKFTAGNWLIDPKPAVPGNQWAGAMNLYDIANASGKAAHMIHIGDQFIGNGTPVNFNTLLYVGSGGDDVTFRDNHIETSGMNPARGYIHLDGLANQIVEDNTEWRLNFQSISPPANAVVYGGGNASVSSRFHSISVGVPTLSACGTSPSLQPGSNNVDGIIIEGVGNPNGCKLSFAAPLRAIKPPCVVENTQGGIPFNLRALDQTGFTVTHGAARLVLSYHCRADW